jgi:hypothetical protein
MAIPSWALKSLQEDIDAGRISRDALGPTAQQALAPAPQIIQPDPEWDATVAGRQSRKEVNGVDPALSNVKESTFGKLGRLGGAAAMNIGKEASRIGALGTDLLMAPYDLVMGKVDPSYNNNPYTKGAMPRSKQFDNLWDTTTQPMHDAIGLKDTTAEHIVGGLAGFIPSLAVSGGLTKAAGLAPMAESAAASAQKALGGKLMGKAANTVVKSSPDMVNTWLMMEGNKPEYKRTPFLEWAAMWAGSELAMKGIGAGVKAGLGKLRANKIENNTTPTGLGRLEADGASDAAGKGNGLTGATQPGPMRARSGQGAEDSVSNIKEEIPLNPDRILSEDISELELNDITGLQAYMRDIYRNFKQVLGPRYEEVKSKVLDKLDDAKGSYVGTQQQYLNDLNEKVVKGLGIKKGSRESELVQLYGEGGGERWAADPVTKQKVKEWIPFSKQDLIDELGEARAQDIIKADAWFRQSYDRLVDDINDARTIVYPGADARLTEITSKIDDLKMPDKYSKNAQAEKIRELEWEINMMRNSPNRPNTGETGYMKELQTKIDDLSDTVKYSPEKQQKLLQELTWELNTIRNNPRRRGTEDTKTIQELQAKIDAVKKDTLYVPQYRQNIINRIQSELDELRGSRQTNLEDTETMRQITDRIERIKNDPIYTAEGRRGLIDGLEAEYERALRGKRLPKRKDYYRHFRELEGLEGLKNIFDSPAQISPGLAGISDTTRPNSKWSSIFQKQNKGDYDIDAVGGFLNYLPNAAYALHIDPQIKNFRQLKDELVEGPGAKGNINHFIEFLEDYANDLAGKTNPFDRGAQKVASRKFFKAVNWVNNRVKSNTILGNAGTMVAQVANIPQGIAFAKQYSFPGLVRFNKSIIERSYKPDSFTKNNPMARSTFLQERYADAMYRPFDTKVLDKAKNGAVAMMETADRIGTEFIWNSCYEKGLANKLIKDPVRYADYETRRLVAGRGIGEVPLMQKAKLFQLVAPFQLEVMNLLHVMKDMKEAKDVTGGIILLMTLYMFNQGAKNIRGSGVTLDPIQAIIDSVNVAQDDKLSTKEKALRIAGRGAGEILSNVPLGQTIAATYPEYGGSVFGSDDLPTRKELFGRSDPTRFGSGLLITKALNDPASKLILPWGGLQLDKTRRGLGALMKQGVYTDDDQLKYPVGTDPVNSAKGLLFGPSAYSEAKDYYENNRRPLSEKQTQQVQEATKQGVPQEQVYNKIIRVRMIDSLTEKINAVWKNQKITQEEKQKQAAPLLRELNEVKAAN